MELISEIEVEDEFYKTKKTIALKSLTNIEFYYKIDFKNYYIDDKNRSTFFAISWDYFFFFIAINKRVFSKKSIENNFFHSRL